MGVEIGKASLEDLANKIKSNTDPPQFPSMEIEGSPELAVVTITVQESPIKPVWAFGRPMKRMGRTNQHLAREEAQRLMEMSSGRTWDALPCEGLTKDKLDPAAFKDYALRSGNPASAAATVLENLHLLTADHKPTNAAALLFAKDPQAFVIEAQVKCGRFNGPAHAVDFLDERTIDGRIQTS